MASVLQNKEGPMANGQLAETSDPRVQALVSFKDWSNYLLVTTVAAVGWIATGMTQAPDVPPIPQDNPFRFQVALWCLAVSAVFGIFALALVPLVSEQMTPKDRSIYRVRTIFRVLTIECPVYLPQVCRPQHILFMIGVLYYAAAFAPVPDVALRVTAFAIAVGVLSTPRK